MARFFTSSWMVRHVVAVVLVALFLLLGWWQLDRATGGNGLSWAYTFEWPLFALFVVALWVREVRAELAESSPERAAKQAAKAEPPLASPFPDASARVTQDASEPSDGDATDAYNRYLAWLSANPSRRPSEYPG